MEKNLLLALDASTKCSGWAIFDCGTKKLVDYDYILCSNKKLHQRIDVMVEEIDKILLKFHPEEVILEEVLPADVKNNNNVFKALIYLQGFIVHLLEKREIKYSFVVSSTWRKQCGIHLGIQNKRESLKGQSIFFVKEHYNLTNINDDVADAICIGHSRLNNDLEKETNPIEKDNKVKKMGGFEFI